MHVDLSSEHCINIYISLSMLYMGNGCEKKMTPNCDIFNLKYKQEIDCDLKHMDCKERKLYKLKFKNTYNEKKVGAVLSTRIDKKLIN